MTLPSVINFDTSLQKRCSCYAGQVSTRLLLFYPVPWLHIVRLCNPRALSWRLSAMVQRLAEPRWLVASCPLFSRTPSAGGLKCHSLKREVARSVHSPLFALITLVLWQRVFVIVMWDLHDFLFVHDTMLVNLNNTQMFTEIYTTDETLNLISCSCIILCYHYQCFSCCSKLIFFLFFC